MPELIRVLSKQEIHNLVSRLAEKISSDFQGKKLVVVGVLKGSFIFLSDLVRALTIPVEIEFVGSSSYGDQSFSSGEVKITKDITLDLKDKDVLLVEDIIDTGFTLQYLLNYLHSLGPNSVRTCAMIDKKERRKIPIAVDYACYATQKGFLVGYGLDYKEQYRNLPEIHHLKI